MKKTVISLLLAIAIICSISVNVFACEDTCPHSIGRTPEITIIE